MPLMAMKPNTAAASTPSSVGRSVISPMGSPSSTTPFSSSTSEPRMAGMDMRKEKSRRPLARKPAGHARGDGRAGAGKARQNGHRLHDAHGQRVLDAHALVHAPVAPPPLADHVAGDEHDAGQVERPDDELPLESGVEVHHQRGDHRGDGRHHQPFEVGLYGVHEHIPYAPPVDGEHRHQRAKVEQYVEQELPVGIDAEDLLQDQQMSRRADGQKFRQALYDAEDQALYGVQAIPPPGDGRRGGEATSPRRLAKTMFLPPSADDVHQPPRHGR